MHGINPARRSPCGSKATFNRLLKSRFFNDCNHNSNMDKKRIIKKEFYNFLKQYNPLPWEEFRKDDHRFNLQKRYTNYALKNRVRFLVTLKRTVKHIAAKKLGILDLGVFPGTWLRILQEYLPSFEIKLSGAGLRAPDEFVKTMKEKFGINIFSVNLDPKNTIKE